MDLRQKHLEESNKYGLIIAAVTQAFLLAATYLYAEGRENISTTLMYVLEILADIGMVVGTIKWGKTEKGHYPVLLGLALSYLLILIGSVHTPYMYAFGVLIGTAVVAYNDTRVCKLACVTAIVENIIFLIVYYATDGPSKNHSTYMVPTNMAFMVLFAVFISLVVHVNHRQTEETLDDIQKRAAEQQKSAEIVKDTSEKISAKLEEANEAMASLSEKVVSSSEAVEQIASSVTMTAESIQTQTEMNSNIMASLENISGESKEMLELSNTVKGNVDAGNKIITGLKAQAEETAKVNSQTAEMTEELANSAETVKKIVSAILSISSQTNLLALNASIEAARAGEAGRGFAVVAEEIRKLSEDTKKSAEEIGTTIETLITNVHNASDNMQLSLESSNKQDAMILETGEKFDIILQSVNTLSKNVEQISTNVDSCVKATSTVMDSISDLSATSEEVAASSESSLTISRECSTDMEKTNGILADILKLSRRQA